MQSFENTRKIVIRDLLIEKSLIEVLLFIAILHNITKNKNVTTKECQDSQIQIQESKDIPCVTCSKCACRNSLQILRWSCTTSRNDAILKILDRIDRDLVAEDLEIAIERKKKNKMTFHCKHNKRFPLSG